MPSTLRAAARDDAARAGAICYEAFKAIAEQHRFPPDLPTAEVGVGLVGMLLERDDIYAVVAESDGRVVGSNFLWQDEAVAAVGPITVDPAVQNRRVGRELMRAVLDKARESDYQSVRLVQAAYHTRSLSLYSKLGFEVREPLSVMQGPALSLKVEGATVRNATSEADADAANALCRRLHGHARPNEVRVALQQGAARVVERAGRITGYTTGVGFFAHSVGETNADLQALIGDATEFPGPGFFVPTRNSQLMNWCLERGFRIVQPMTLMTMGRYQEPQGAYLPSVLY